jgi:hypothetical protein
MNLGKFELGADVPIIWQATIPEGSSVTSEPMLRITVRDIVGRDTEVLAFDAMDSAGNGKYVYIWAVPYTAIAKEYTVSYSMSIDNLPLTKEDDTFTVSDPVVTPSEIRNKWCFGLPLNKSDGSVISDADIYGYIKGAVNEVERKLSIALKPQTIRCNASARALALTAYDVEEPPYDYDFKQFSQWGYLQLRKRPVLSVDDIKIVLPNGQEVLNLMQWLKLYKKPAQLHVVPYAGTPFMMVNVPGIAFPLLSGNLGRNLPQAIWVDYTAGMSPVPEDIKNVIAKIASIDVLGIAGDAILAGIASLSTSVDGLSESYSTTASATNATYGAHILQYQKEIDNFFDPKSGGARTYYKGFSMSVI